MTIEFFAEHAGFRLQVHETKIWAGGEPHIKFSARADRELAIMRGANSDDLVLLCIWAQEMHKRGTLTTLLLPYLPGARADRGESLSARVYADIINAAGIDFVICLDPHSPIAPWCYARLTEVGAYRVLRHAKLPKDIVAVVAPDKGAVRRAALVATELEVPVIHAEKHRAKDTGTLSGFKVQGRVPANGTLLVVDDICDAGGTFMGLADVLADAGVPRERLALWVTHGVFSYGALDRLPSKYAWIGSTDSHPGSDDLETGECEIAGFKWMAEKVSVMRVYDDVNGNN